MAVTAADVKVVFSSENADKVKKDLDSVGDSTTSLSERTKALGSKLTLGLTAPIGAMFTKAFMGAAGLEQAFGKTEAVFGNATDSVIAWSQGSADAFGLSQSEALAMVSTYGAILNAQGVAADTSKAYSQDLIQLSADMAAFNDVSTDRAGVALRGALTGEYEALKSLGVVMTAAEVDTRALAIATAEGRDEITEADKVMARYQILMEKTAQQQGSFAAEADGASGSMAIFQAHLKDAANNIGRHLLPAGTKLIRKLTDLVRWVDGLSETQQKWVIGIGLAAAAIGPLLIAVGALVPMLSAGVAVFAALFSPITLVVGAIALLAAGAIYAYQNFEPFREAVDAVAAALRDFAADAIEKVIAGWNKLKDAFDAEGWSGVWDALMDGAIAAWEGILAFGRDTISSIVSAISNVDWGALVQGGWDLLQQGIALAWDAITSLEWSDFVPLLDWALWIGGKIVDIAVWVWDKISAHFPSASVIGGAIENFASFVWGKISTHFPDYSVLKGAIANFAGYVWSKIKEYFPSELLVAGNKIVEFATWIWSKISAYFPSSDLITGAIADFGTWLYEKIGAPTLSFPSKDEILDAIKSMVGLDGGGGGNHENDGGDHSFTGVGGTQLSFSGGMGGLDTSSIDAFGGALVALRRTIAGTEERILTFVATTVGVMGGWSTGLQTMLGTASSDFTTKVGTATTTAQTSMTTFVAATIGVMGGWTVGIQTIVNTAMDTLKTRASGGTSSAKSSFITFVADTISVMAGWSTGLGNIVNGAMQNMVSRARSGGSDMASALRRGAENGVSGVRDVLGRIPGIVNSIAGQGASAAYNAGAAIGAGFANGMRAFLGQIQAAAAAMVDAAQTAVEARARITSPSKLFRGLGEYVGEGFEEGIRSMVPDVARATAALVSVPTMPAYSAIGTSSSASSGARTGGTVVNNYHKTEYIALSTSDLQRLLTEIEQAPERTISVLNAAERTGPM